MTETEEHIVRARQGDRSAFASLVAQFHGDLYRLAFSVLGNHHDAEDALQEAYISAYKGLVRFRGESRLDTWFYRITLNRCLDLRKRRRGTVVSLSGEHVAIDPLDTDPVSDPERQLRSARIRGVVDASMDRLSPLEYKVFILRHHREMALAEIAQVLERSEGTIKNILFRAVCKVRDSLRRHDLGIEEVAR